MRYLLTGGPNDGRTLVTESTDAQTVLNDDYPEGKYVRIGLQETVEVLMWVEE